jgi:hypothetical protein
MVRRELSRMHQLSLYNYLPHYAALPAWRTALTPGLLALGDIIFKREFGGHKLKQIAGSLKTMKNDDERPKYVAKVWYLNFS